MVVLIIFIHIIIDHILNDYDYHYNLFISKDLIGLKVIHCLNFIIVNHFQASSHELHLNHDLVNLFFPLNEHIFLQTIDFNF